MIDDKNFVTKPIILLHFIMPNQLGGHNIVMKRILESSLKNKYDFRILNQDKVAGGRINLKLMFNLMKKIRKVNPDIIHISGLQSAGFHCLCAAKMAKCKKIMITIHGFSEDSMGISKIKGLIFKKFVEPFTLRKADLVIGNSKFTSSRYMVMKYAPNHGDYVYNIPPKPYNGVNSFREEIDVEDNDILVVTASRIVIDKGYKLISDAIKRLKYLSNVKYVIIGNGRYLETFKKDLEKEIKDKTVFILNERNDIQRIFSASDIFILPSYHETLSNVTLEASIEGLGIIVSNTGGLREIIRHKENGLLIEPGNARELANAIKYLVNNPEERKKFGENAKRNISINFNEKDILGKLDGYYQRLLNDK